MNEKRIKLGIIFNFSPQWMGGIIYVINLVKTLNHLDEKKKPEIFLFYNINLKKFLNEFDYPYFNTIEWSFPSVVKGNLMSWFLRKNVFYDTLIEKYSLDVVFPANSYPIKNRTNTKIIAWYADLQHKYYPEFFSKLAILHRNFRIYLILRNANYLIVSSDAVKSDFHKFYKIKKDLRVHVFHFTSVNDDYSKVDINELRNLYGLPEQYFMVSNQFHKHKNHKIVFLALAELKHRGIIKNLALTGKLPSSTNSPYMADLHKVIEENGLQNQIFLLGVIPRSHQIKIMEHSLAVIQPSLFEGWSTVIEDAMSLQVPVIASNLKVNIEQLDTKGIYFNPENKEELVSILTNFIGRSNFAPIYGDYKERIINAAEGLIEIFRE